MGFYGDGGQGIPRRDDQKPSGAALKKYGDVGPGVRMKTNAYILLEKNFLFLSAPGGPGISKFDISIKIGVDPYWRNAFL